MSGIGCTVKPGWYLRRFDSAQRRQAMGTVGGSHVACIGQDNLCGMIPVACTICVSLGRALWSQLWM